MIFVKVIYYILFHLTTNKIEIFHNIYHAQKIILKFLIFLYLLIWRNNKNLKY